MRFDINSLIFYLIGLAIGLIIGIVIKPKKYQGTLLVGFNEYTGKRVYRFEYDIPEEELAFRKDLHFKVKHTGSNLGINTRLYDLEDEGIRR